MRKPFELAAAVIFAWSWLPFCHAYSQPLDPNAAPHFSVLTMQVAETDLNTILPGGNAGPVTPQSAPPSLQPTYEKWDVLRQYPRFVPVPPPQSQPPAVKPQEVPKPSKENQNA